MTIASATATDFFASLQAEPASTATTQKAEDLGQEDFLRLMIAQLENQDPSKPMDNFEFLSQIAQFGTVSGLDELKASFDSFGQQFFSSTAVDSAAMLGKTAILSTNNLYLPSGEQGSASIEVPQNYSNLQVYVQDQLGNLVRQVDLTDVQAGTMDFTWDGLDDQGDPVVSGLYSISAGSEQGDQSVSMSVFAQMEIDSVLFDQQDNSVILGLGSGYEVSLSEVVGFK